MLFRKPQEQVVKLHIDPEVYKQAKNLDGAKGAVCNNCGGYGFTMRLKGGTIGCAQCEATGVRNESRDELQAKIARQDGQINDLIKDLGMLKKALLETLEHKGLSINTNVKETLNGE